MRAAASAVSSSKNRNKPAIVATTAIPRPTNATAEGARLSFAEAPPPPSLIFMSALRWSLQPHPCLLLSENQPKLFSPPQDLVLQGVDAAGRVELVVHD